jgi:hypothetical protein
VFVVVVVVVVGGGGVVVVVVVVVVVALSFHPNPSIKICSTEDVAFYFMPEVCSRHRSAVGFTGTPVITS